MITKTARLVRPAVLAAAGALLLGVALSIARVPAHAATTTIVVTGTGDTASPPVCTTSCATLRGAVAAANALTTTSGNDVAIVLPAGTIDLTAGELDIASSTNKFMTIEGPTPGNPAAAVVNQQTAGWGVFVVALVANVTTNFQDLTITGGTANNVNTFGGGAILSGDTGDLLTLTDCVITNNLSSASGGGGGVLMSPGGSMTITNSTISNNDATEGYSGGAGIANDGGHGASVLTISGSTITGNSATDGADVNPFGGGVYFDGGGNAGSSLSITRTAFSNNTAGKAGTVAGKGGALYANGPASITLTTFTGNQVFDGGTSGAGGAVWHDAGALTLGTGRIVANTGTIGSGLFQDTNAGSITADNDWWGADTGPGGAVAGGGTGVTPSTPHWLQLRHVPTASGLHPLTSTTLTADFLQRSDASILPTGTLNGLKSFAAVFGNAVHGSLSNTTQFVNGVATATISAGSVLGPASADVTADNQTATANLTVRADTTTSVGSNHNPTLPGQGVQFTATVTSSTGGTIPGTPQGGTVQFQDEGGNLGAAVSVVNGVATTPPLSNLAVGTHPVTATYSGDADFNASTSPAANQVVSGFATTTTVVSPANPSVFGEPVTFTATVDSGGNGTPSGTIQFAVDGSSFGAPVALSGGAATTPPISDLTTGNHTVTATYSGSSGFGGSTGSLPGGQTVGRTDSTTTVASSVSPSAFGQPVSFTAAVAAVAPGAGTPTGQVQFFVDGSSFGGPVPLTGGAAVSGVTSSLAVGTHPVTATYAGDANFNGGASTVLNQVVGQINATTVVTTTAYPSAFGQLVTFTATVTGARGTPTGSIQFGVDGLNLGGPVPLTGGVATSTATASLAVGVHNVTATYGGDVVYRAGGSGFTQLTKLADTRTAVASSANPSEFGQAVVFTATVGPVPPGAGTAGGAVQFLVDGSNLGAPVALTAGVAGSGAVSSLGVGPHTVMANYLGDGSFNASGGSLTPVGQVVAKSDSSTAVSTSPNPSAFGQAVLFTAQVSAAGTGAGTPDGTVQFVIDGSSFGGPVTLSGGSAVSGSLASLAVGSHTVRADYNGSASFKASSGTLAGGQAVTTASTTTTLASSRNPSAAGDAVEFTATVIAVAPGAGEPGGTVQFVIDGTNAGGPVTLAAGVATYSTGNLAAGNHTVAAAYSGSAGFDAASGTLPGGQTVASPAMADLSVITFGPPRAVVGLPAIFAIGVVNNGPSNATGVVVSDGLPAGWTPMAELTTQGSCSPALPSVTCTIGNMAAGAQVSITLIVVPTAPGTAISSASVTGEQGDSDQQNNTASATTLVRRFGYWLFGSDGGVFAFGDAGFFGSTASMAINAPIVAMAATPTGKGYWMFASDGGVFAFGDAGFHGSTGDRHLSAPITGMAPTPTGRGYWLVGSDGAVYPFGDAGFSASASDPLSAPITGMSATPSGHGYWLAGSDGAVYPFGDASALGSLAGSPLNSPIQAMAATADGQGYWLAAADGGVFSFGGAPFLGSLSGQHLNRPIAGLISNG